jgi:hypothetical protein
LLPKELNVNQLKLVENPVGIQVQRFGKYIKCSPEMFS